jgi:transcriptional regulator with XRE-family HTH domain
MDLRQLAIQLEDRRKRLGMSCAAVASRTGLGLRTVQRALSADPIRPDFATLAAIANALGASIRIGLDTQDIATLKRRQAERKATRLVSLTQGTSALEAQAVPKIALERMKRKTVSTLLRGSSRRLWAE